MNANMVRMGGIAIFVMLAVAIIGGILVGAASVQVVNGKVVSTGPGIGGIVLNIINTLLLIFAIWATKGYFNAKGHTRSDVMLLGIIVCLIIMLILGFIGGAGLGAITSPQAAVNAAGIIGIISLIVTLVFLVFLFIVAVQMMGFATIGGGIWKALGILLLIGLGCLILGVLMAILAVSAGSGGLIAVMGILMLIGALVLLAALIVWGIALIIGAGKMAA